MSHTTLPPQSSLGHGPQRVRWTREQASAIADAGILEGRYELIDGEILLKIGQKPESDSSRREILKQRRERRRRPR
jgi:hypothetical protein